VVATEVSDISTDVGVRLRAVKTQLTKIHVSLAKWTVGTMLRSVSTVFYLLTLLQAGCPRKKPHRNLLFPKRGPTTLIGFLSSSFTHLQKCLLALSISTYLGSRKAYRIFIQLVTAIGLPPHKPLLCPLLDLWLSHYVMSVPYLNRACFLDTNSGTSSRGTRTRARSNEWDMTAEHAFSWLCDELKHSVNKSGCLDDAKQIASYLNCSQDDVAGSRKPSKPIYICA